MSKSRAASPIFVILVLSANRLLAPIQEESPTPAPTEQATAKPKPKRTTKPKPKSEASESTKNSVRQQPKSSSFAGKWVGTMPEVPRGNVATELIVDQTETMMDWQESGKKKGRSKTTLNGNTLQANFQVGVTATWSLTPHPGGATAQVRLQAFMNDQTAIFHRTPAAPKTSAPSR